MMKYEEEDQVDPIISYHFGFAANMPREHLLLTSPLPVMAKKTVSPELMSFAFIIYSS